MKTTTLNVNSWHYKLASGFGYDPDFKDHDICAYLRRVMLGMIVVPFIVAIVAGFVTLFSIMLVNMVLGPWFLIFYGLPLNEIAIMGWSLVGFSIFISGGGYMFQKYKTYRMNKKFEQRQRWERGEYVEPESNFLKLAYASYKDKFCMKLQFVQADGQPYETSRQRRDRIQQEKYEAWRSAHPTDE